MIRVPKLCAALSAVSLLTLATVSSAQPRPEYTWGFEDGTLSGWTAAGDAFANQPTFGNNVVIRRPGESPGQDGDWWLGTYENHPSNSVQVCCAKNSGVVRSEVNSHALALAPFSQNSNFAGLAGCGHAHDTQVKPRGLF